jgi:DNA-binding SARP family transcriptional activator/predicted ATPase
MHVTDRSDSHAPILQIHLFGGLTIQVNGRRITDLATRKAEALLIYLVCNPQTHQRETLADLLWDDLPAERAAGNLRLTLNQLRKHFAPFLDVTRQTIALRQDVECYLDVREFTQILAARSHDGDMLDNALALYRGDFLQGFHLRDARGFSEWQASQSDYWQQQARTHMQALIALYSAHSNYTQAIAWASRVLALDSLDEAAHRQLMLLLARSGQRTAALRQYRACQQIMQQELGIDPEPATEALYQRITRMSAQRPHNLPGCTGTLLGRTAELARLYAWLAAPTSRLMSIVGTGGSGKTQIALTTGWRVVNEYLGPCSDGVFYIPLILHDSSAVLIDDIAFEIALAEALQIRVSSKSRVLDQLIEQLCDKEVLLIVDNGELLNPSARLALSALIQHTQSVRILLPSRERLKLRDEHVLDLSGLRYPSFPSHIVTPHHEQRLADDILDYPSVQLFFERARQIQGVAALNYDILDRIAIGKICQIVHGLPLAIELVVPWVRVRSPAEIVPEIARTIDLLAIDMRDIPERHRSIRAVFEYSWQLITDEERLALAQLAVFPASFTAEAAEAIAAVTLQRLASLRDKSLIQCMTADSGTRYVLHPLLRSLAQEKLQSNAATSTIYALHARYFAAWVASYEEHLRSDQGPAILQRLASEMDNLRVGWQWAIEARDLVKLGQYSIPLHDFCAIRGWELEGRHLFRKAATAIRAWHPDEDTPEVELLWAARVLSCYAQLEYVLGALDTAEDALQHGRRILSLQAIEDAPELMFIYEQLGLITYRRGAYTDAMSYLQLALHMAEDSNNLHKAADALLSIGGVAYAQGNWAYARQALQRCQKIYQGQSYHWGIGHTLRFFGMIALMEGDPAAAQRYYQESLALTQQIGSRIGEALVYDQMGMLHLAEFQLEQSRALIQQGLTIFQEIGVDVGIVRALGHLGRVAIAQANDQAAQQYILQALQIAQRVQAAPLLIESAAVALHFCQHLLGDDDVHPSPQWLLWSLQQHPACAADVRYYIMSLLCDYHPEPGESRQPWPLEQMLATVTTWIAGASKHQTRERLSSILA